LLFRETFSSYRLYVSSFVLNGQMSRAVNIEQQARQKTKRTTINQIKVVRPMNQIGLNIQTNQILLVRLTWLSWRSNHFPSILRDQNEDQSLIQ
jgi:hypothetical protein